MTMYVTADKPETAAIFTISPEINPNLSTASQTSYSHTTALNTYSQGCLSPNGNDANFPLPFPSPPFPGLPSLASPPQQRNQKIYFREA